jgi:hypothetical protein
MRISPDQVPASGDHVELGVESWKEMLDQAEQEYEARQMELLLARIPWPEQEEEAA